MSGFGTHKVKKEIEVAFYNIDTGAITAALAHKTKE